MAERVHQIKTNPEFRVDCLVTMSRTPVGTELTVLEWGQYFLDSGIPHPGEGIRMESVWSSIVRDCIKRGLLEATDKVRAYRRPPTETHLLGAVTRSPLYRRTASTTVIAPQRLLDEANERYAKRHPGQAKVTNISSAKR
jgi:hypothetical protein